jgi:cellulose synthase operon protein C
MRVRRVLPQYIALACLGMARAAYCAGPPEQTAASGDYYSVQLLSAPSAAPLRTPLTRVAQQPFARIERRGNAYALRVGLWRNRDEAQTGLETLRNAFPGAFVRTAHYSGPDNAEPQNPSAATALLPPAPAEVSGKQSQLIAMRETPQKNLLPDPEIPLPATANAAPSPGREQAHTRSPAQPDTTPLWNLLREGRYRELDATLASLHRRYPRWSPPPKLLALRNDAENRSRIIESLSARDAQSTITLAQRYPSQFTCNQVDFLWGLAEAYHALHDSQHEIAVYRRIIADCPKPEDRIATLQKASVALAPDAFADLLQREARVAAGNERESLAQIRYDAELRQFQRAAEAKDTERAIALVGSLEPALRARKDAKNAALVAWAYFNAGQNGKAEEWFTLALSWQPALDEARYGRALTEFRLNRLDEAEADLRAADADNPRSRKFQGDIAFARATHAYADRDFKASLGYLESADKAGTTGRDSAILRAWNNYQLGNYAESAAQFTNLYQQQADAESADGLVYSLLREGKSAQLAQLAATLDGSLQERWTTIEAQRYYDRKLFIVAAATAPGEFPQLDNIGGTSLALGAAVRDKSGDSGTSRFQLTKAPFADALLVHTGNTLIWLRMSEVNLDSGGLAPNAMVGSFLPGGKYLVAPTTRLRDGIEGSLAFRHEGWLTTYGDIGMTPSGGALPSMPVGSLGILQQTEFGKWQAEAFSRPVLDSILSYTGITDPYTGQSWGRVRRTGISVEGSMPLSGSWTGTARLQAADLQGSNVASNHAESAGLGAATNLKLSGFDYFSVGPDLSFDTYQKNLYHFTLGQGGYFSPQQLTSVGASLHFLTPEARQYIIKGDFAAGGYDKHEAASHCFPLAAPAGADPACSYSSDSASGLYYSAQLLGVQRLSNNLQWGGALVLRRSPDYNDRAAILFLRYTFDRRGSVMSGDLPAAVLQSLY